MVHDLMIPSYHSIVQPTDAILIQNHTFDMSDPEGRNGGVADPISKAVVDIGRSHTFYKNVRGERFNLVALHRMNMHYLRKRLLDESATIFAAGEMKDENSKALTSLMQDYCSCSL